MTKMIKIRICDTSVCSQWWSVDPSADVWTRDEAREDPGGPTEGTPSEGEESLWAEQRGGHWTWRRRRPSWSADQQSRDRLLQRGGDGDQEEEGQGGAEQQGQCDCTSCCYFMELDLCQKNQTKILKWQTKTGILREHKTQFKNKT